MACKMLNVEQDRGLKTMVLVLIKHFKWVIYEINGGVEMKRSIMFLSFLLLTVAPLAIASAATVYITNNCNQNVTVSVYSEKTHSDGYLLAQKIANAHNSYTVTTSSPVKCIGTSYPQPGYSTVGNYFYFDRANNLTVRIIMHPENSNACSISVTEP